MNGILDYLNRVYLILRNYQQVKYCKMTIRWAYNEIRTYNLWCRSQCRVITRLEIPLGIYKTLELVNATPCKNKTNHPISSNSHPSATSNRTIKCLQCVWDYNSTGNIIQFRQNMKRCNRRTFRKIIHHQECL